MSYRLPLELELAILTFAAPPLAIDSLHDRVAFFINVSLVHRSLTAWAQERLRDQFLYTYRRRSDEHERLRTRLDAGFGRDRPLRRLYLGLTRLPNDIDERKYPETDSVSTMMDVYASATCPATFDRRVIGPIRLIGVRQLPCEAVAHFMWSWDEPLDDHWELCAMIKAHSQMLDTLWLELPFKKLDISDLPPPRILHIDDQPCSKLWGSFKLIPISSKTVLSLRHTCLCPLADKPDYDLRHLVLADCWNIEGPVHAHLRRFRHLETLIACESRVDVVSTIVTLATSIRRVHILQRAIRTSWYHDPIVLPHLESFTFTMFLSEHAPADAASDALAEVQHAVESSVVALQCTFRYLSSTKLPEDALADAMADLGLDS